MYTSIRAYYIHVYNIKLLLLLLLLFLFQVRSSDDGSGVVVGDGVIFYCIGTAGTGFLTDCFNNNNNNNNSIRTAATFGTMILL